MNDESPLGRDGDWILAMGHALGLDSGIKVPIVPSVDAFRELFAAVRARPSTGEAPALSDERSTVLLEVIQRLNSNRYNLTKSECISEIEKMRLTSKRGIQMHDDLTAASPQVPQAPLPSLSVVLEQRGGKYGPFVGHAEVTQRLKNVIGCALRERDKFLSADQQEALDMICHKIGRIINGDADYDDSWIDIAGYAQLVATRLRKSEAAVQDLAVALGEINKQNPRSRDDHLQRSVHA